MKTFALGWLIVGAGLVAGCASSGPRMDMNRIAQMYYAQQRTRVYPAIEITNVNDLHVSGSNMHFVVNTHMEPVSLIPRDPSALESLVPAAKDIVLGGLGILGATHVMSKMADQPRTVEPTVVRPEVVSPEVVTVPGL